MAQATLYTTKGEATGRSVPLPDSVFGVEVNNSAVHAAVLTYQTNQSKARPKTLGRTEVRGGGRKPYRQKGTGRARQGSRVAPHYRGGGIVFGPNGRLNRRRLPKRLKRLAIRSVLSARAGEEQVAAVEPLELTEPSTSEMAQALNSMGLSGRKVIIIMAEQRPVTYKSLRNLRGVEVRVAPSFCAYDIVNAETVLLEEAAIEIIERTFGSPPSRGRGAVEGGDA